ncbi:recombinase family protein [Shewanella sp. KT0246]|uniref:recombinase family protein n=1 Tax=Shewanella sp. KT0246 TaxID=2815912 RepID=UPI001BBDD0D1|nr:recombinase family protein [Shewanella sp. KT0246]GIU50278.1 integrase [Shewanella sp. KT0246]
MNNKVIFAYNRVSTQGQAEEGRNGLENQRHINDQAVTRLMETDSLQRLPDVIEVGSAFKGANLGDVLERVRSGYYPVGSVCVMFDQTRFSRNDFLDAALRMREITEAGLNIHFSTSGETVDAGVFQDFGQFVGLIAKAQSANEESTSRSNRTTASYQRKVDAGELVTLGALPNWIRKVWDTSGSHPRVTGFELHPDRVDVINKVFDMFIDGHGATTITRWLNDNIEPWPEFDGRRARSEVRVWRESYISKIITNPATIGRRTFNVGKSNESVVDNYFPAVVTLEKYYQAKQIKQSKARGNSGGTKYPVNFMKGLVKCGYCGANFGIQNFKNPNKGSSIRCTAYAKNEVSRDVCAGGTSPSRYLEQTIIEYCSDVINYNSIFKSQKVDTGELEANIHQHKATISDVDIKLTRLEDLYLDGDITKNRYLSRKEGMEELLASERTLLASLEDELNLSKHTATDIESNFLEVVKQAREGRLDDDVRLRLRVLLPKFIDKIEVWQFGSEWKSQKTWDEFKEKFPDIDLHESMGDPTLKTKNITYGIHFTNGYFRAFWWDSEADTWRGKADNKGAEWK